MKYKRKDLPFVITTFSKWPTPTYARCIMGYKMYWDYLDTGKWNVLLKKKMTRS